MIVWVFKKSTAAKETIYIYTYILRIIAYSLLIDVLNLSASPHTSSQVLCIDALELLKSQSLSEESGQT